MNFPLVSKLISVVMLILAVAFGVCFCVSYLLDTTDALLARKAFAAAIGTALLSATLLFWIGRNAGSKFLKKEALCTIGLAWILASLVGSIPYIILTPQLGFAGSIFESTSGLTTTGASVMSDLETLPRSLLFWRALSQWIGGMGVVVFFVAILGFLGADAKILYANEASGSITDFEESRVQKMVLHLIYLYAGLSILCCIAYWLAGMNWFDAICHMFTTVSTAGFSTRSESIAAFHSPTIEWVAILFMILAGINFFLQLRLIRGNVAYAKRNTELRLYFGMLLAASAIISVSLVLENTIPEIGRAIRESTFNVVSIMTTTGYATEDFASWSTIPQSILLAAMLIGGCSGSTSGGIKVFRLAIAIKMGVIAVERSFRSRVVRYIRINDQIVDERTMIDTLLFLALSAMILVASTILISIFEPGHQLDTSLSAVPACMFNIGPGLKEVGPTETYDFFHPHSKLLLSLLMIMGRLEFYAVLALFTPSLWKRFD